MQLICLGFVAVHMLCSSAAAAARFTKYSLGGVGSEMGWFWCCVCWGDTVSFAFAHLSLQLLLRIVRTEGPESRSIPNRLSKNQGIIYSVTRSLRVDSRSDHPGMNNRNARRKGTIQ